MLGENKNLKGNALRTAYTLLGTIIKLLWNKCYDIVQWLQNCTHVVEDKLLGIAAV